MNMTKPWKRLFSLCVYAYIFMIGSVQAQSPCTTPDYVANRVEWAREFLLTFFPEFMEYPTKIQASDQIRFDSKDYKGFHLFEITLRPWREGSSSGFPETIGYAADSEFRFRRDDLFSSWQAQNDPAQMINFQKLVDSHPEWSEGEIRDALIKAGAHFAPGAEGALVNSLPMEELRKLFGEVRVGGANFYFREFDRLQPGAAVLQWHVEMQVSCDGKPHHGYVLLVEPFSGKLFGIGLNNMPEDKS
jgi:hypothetical protein